MRTIKFSYIFQYEGMIMNQIFSMEEIEGGDFINQIKAKFQNWEFIARRQFTGLLDKNGKEIYEGDIVQHYLNRGFIEFHDGGYYLKTSDGNSQNLFSTEKNCEIIGNIYENPELLE